MVKQKKWLFFFHGCDNMAALSTGAQMLGWEFKWYFLSVLCWCFLAMVYAKAHTYHCQHVCTWHCKGTAHFPSSNPPMAKNAALENAAA